jgi:(1->4)-alpha-D-glucan 1-alpha-D-glucosylmutase
MAKGGGVAAVTEPLATYRLQLNAAFPFDAAADLAGYLRDLGVSHIYCSPSLQAAPGSTHGYDVIDPTHISDELGGAAGFARLVAAARDHGLGLLLDIVPNHMAAHRDNPWWWDVLAGGDSSAFAPHFDIDWESSLDPSMRGQVMVPVLDDHVGRVIDRGDLRLDRRADGCVVARYGEHEVPISSPAVLPDVDAINADPAELYTLLAAQHHRLARWRLALRVLNYRRFFDITSLVGLHAERAETFHATHALVLDMLRRGDLDGVRVDHVDGLVDPAAYLQRLRDAAGRQAWVVVEKILDDGEELPAEWPVQGTTGYDFVALTTRLLVHPGGEAPLFALHADLGGRIDLDAEVRAAKLQVMRDTLAPDVERLVLLLARVCAARPRHRDHTRDELRDALAELIAALPVYRTYAVAGHDASDEDAARLAAAGARVRAVRPDVDGELLDLLCALVVDHAARDGDAAATELVQRLQQTSAAVMAKGMEDTTFYRFTPLLALDEVGCAPLPFSAGVADFHGHNLRLQERWPQALLATSTHDTKRSADVRARLALLSEMPVEWAATVRAWRGRNQRHRRSGGSPDAMMEHLLYQSMVGAWPVDRERMLACMLKSAREAKVHTSWIHPSPAYEAALVAFVEAVYDDEDFLAELEAVVQPLVELGRDNALAMVALQLTSPGVPDVYQGNEMWDLSLVDPDNRRPVDYAERRRVLERSRTISASDTWAAGADVARGLPKLLLIRRALALRHLHPELFDARGTYHPLQVSGVRAEHVVAFARGAAPGAVTVVPRWPLRLGGAWHDTAVTLPDDGPWHDQLTGGVVSGRIAALTDLLRDFPVALLAREAMAP